MKGLEDAVNIYNNQSKYHVNTDEITHGLQFRCDWSIDDLEQLLRTRCIKRTQFKSNAMNIMNERAVIKCIDTKLAKFKMSNLMVGIDAKLYHSIYAASDRVKRARMHARRSKYALAFANQYIGRDFKRQCEMTNDEWNYALRSSFGLDIDLFDYDLDGNAIELRCNRCNYAFTSIEDILDHAFKCRNGKGPQWRHDEMNKLLFNGLFRNAFIAARLEPRRLDNSGSRDRPDMIIPQNIAMCIGGAKYCGKVYTDTMICDTLAERNVKKFEGNLENKHISIFTCGMDGYNDKQRAYENKFADLNDFKFVPLIVERQGGLSSELRSLCDAAIASKERKSKYKKSIERRNWYSGLSCGWWRIQLESIRDHIVC
eukprot:524436_1